VRLLLRFSSMSRNRPKISHWKILKYFQRRSKRPCGRRFQMLWLTSSPKNQAKNPKSKRDKRKWTSSISRSATIKEKMPAKPKIRQRNSKPNSWNNTSKSWRRKVPTRTGHREKSLSTQCKNCSIWTFKTYWSTKKISWVSARFYCKRPSTKTTSRFTWLPLKLSCHSSWRFLCRKLS